MITYMAKRVDMQNIILIDADALISMAVENDNGHEWAKKIVGKLKNSWASLYLSSYAYGEVLTVVSMRIGLAEALRLEKVIKKMSKLVIVDVDSELRESGLVWFSRQTSKNSRFTNCVNMALMEKLGIREIFSRDKHYKQNGFLRLGMD